MSEESTRFGRLTFTGQSEVRERHTYWLCRCDCGNTKWFYAGNVKRGKSKSCGCLRNELTKVRCTSHGYIRNHVYPPEYSSWNSMRKRCSSPKIPNFPAYGGRGIKVCERWQDSFAAFFKDVGPKPSPDHQLDRINTNGNYEPGNVRWVTRKQNCRNGRHNVVVTIEGMTACVAEQCERFGIKRGRIRHHVETRGRSYAEAFALERARPG